MSTETKVETRKSFAYLISIIALFALIIGARFFIYDTYFIPTESMEKTLMVDDQIVTLKTNITDYNRGDIIVFNDDNGWLNGSGMKGTLVKRIIAVAGDTVECCSIAGQIIVNGQPVSEKYITGVNMEFTKQVVPKGAVFVAGDNREFSADSRLHIDEKTQFIKETSITGVVKIVYVFFDKFEIMNSPSEWAMFNRLDINNMTEK